MCSCYKRCWCLQISTSTQREGKPMSESLCFGNIECCYVGTLTLAVISLNRNVNVGNLTETEQTKALFFLDDSFITVVGGLFWSIHFHV